VYRLLLLHLADDLLDLLLVLRPGHVLLGRQLEAPVLAQLFVDELAEGAPEAAKNRAVPSAGQRQWVAPQGLQRLPKPKLRLLLAPLRLPQPALQPAGKKRVWLSQAHLQTGFHHLVQPLYSLL